MRAEMVPLTRIKRLPGNAKGHDAQVIHGAISAFGFLERIIINETTGRMIAGHGRTKDLVQRKLKGERPPTNVEERGGEWYVPADFVQVPEEQEDAAAIALNQATIAGGFDDEALASVLADIAAQSEALLAATGFGGEALDELLRSIAPPDVDFKEYGENAADDVEFHECPSCGHRWPK